ncbi:MAG: dTMP kinase [bacterium]|nr:dTMP kinase [bacterium]
MTGYESQMVSCDIRLAEFSLVSHQSSAYIPIMTKRGILISFEGVDGSGKSTQARMLYDYLKANRFNVLFIREPGGTPVSESVRAILLDNSHKQMSARAELLLFLAARAELVDKVIEPALKQGKIVITDRFSDSTIAYQIDGRKLPAKVVKDTNEFAAAKIKPNLTFIVDLEIAKAHVRLKANKDRMESAASDFHKRVRNGFLKIAKAEPRRVKVVDGRNTPEEIFTEILAVSQAFLNRRKIGPQKRTK